MDTSIKDIEQRKLSQPVSKSRFKYAIDSPEAMAEFLVYRQEPKPGATNPHHIWTFAASPHLFGLRWEAVKACVAYLKGKME